MQVAWVVRCPKTTHHLANEDLMKTYEQAKEEMISQINNLQEVIKFLRENAYYEKICGSCSTKMRLRVNDYRANERKFCNDACRARDQRRRDKSKK